MTLPAPLRYRVALGYGLIGLALSLAFAAATTFVSDDYEEIFVAALLKGQAETYLQRLAADPRAVLPRSPQLSLYRQSEAPLALRALAPGSHELDFPGHEGVHVGVFEAHGQRLVSVLDVGQVETLERYLWKLMLAAVIGGTAISAWLGWLLSARTIRPVVRLAQAVEDLPMRPVATQLASGYSEDGIGSLAAAIDRYQGRLAAADGKEREFFADASHELRTPIAVIQGAIEVLKDDPDTTASQGNKLARIERSITELASLLEALLLSARGVPEQVDVLDMRELCLQAMERLLLGQPDARYRIGITGQGPGDVRGPARWVACILDVLFHRVLFSSPKAIWRVLLSDTGLTISQPVDVQDGIGQLRRSDLGLGIVFVERLSHALGWKLEQHLSPSDGLSISLQIPKAR